MRAALLFISALVLVGVLWLQLDPTDPLGLATLDARPWATPAQSGEASADTAEVGSQMATPLIDRHELPSLDALSETRGRPLFRPDRRPFTVPLTPVTATPDEADPDQPVASPLGEISLSAIVIVDDEPTALVREGGEVRELRIGETYRGWTVQDIEPTKVIFSSGTQSEEVELRSFPAAGQTPQPNTEGTNIENQKARTSVNSRARARVDGDERRDLERRRVELERRRIARREARARRAQRDREEPGENAPAGVPSSREPSSNTANCGMSRC